MNKPLLSICIPTYNRVGKLFSDITHYLAVYAGDDMEVVVVDNASTDDTQQLMKSITDPRLLYVRHEKNIGGMSNIITCLTMGHGHWSMLLLDKDHLHPELLLKFMERLRSLPPDVATGQVRLNIDSEGNSQIFTQGFEALRKLGYTREHPTGTLVKTKLLKNNGIVNMLLAQHPTCPFNVDVIKAHLAMLGAGWRAEIPLLSTETPEAAAREVSHTYSAQNLWFAPAMQRQTAHTFMYDCTILGGGEMTAPQMSFMLLRLYYYELYACTFNFQDTMQMSKICAHHGIEPRRVSLGEMMREHFACAREFVCARDLPLHGVRIAITAIVGTRWFAKLIRRII